MADNDSEKLLREYIKQKEELEKLISELQPKTTNIPFSYKFTDKYSPYHPDNILQQDKNELLKLKLFVNKKCNKISNDPEHTQKLVNELKQYENNLIFKNLFLLKLLDQGKVQVSSCIDFYKPLGFILSSLSESYMEQYIRFAIYKKVSMSEIKGVYAIYFGALYYRNNFSDTWFFLASILNTQPSELTAYVLESFFFILSGIIANHSIQRLRKIYNYLNTFYFSKMNNIPIETRIKKYIEQYL